MMFSGLEKKWLVLTLTSPYNPRCLVRVLSAKVTCLHVLPGSELEKVNAMPFLPLEFATLLILFLSINLLLIQKHLACSWCISSLCVRFWVYLQFFFLYVLLACGFCLDLMLLLLLCWIWTLLDVSVLVFKLKECMPFCVLSQRFFAVYSF